MSAIIEIAVNQWAEVVKENDADKEFVTTQQRNDWEEFKARTTERLKSIIESYDGNLLSQTDEHWLQTLGKTISDSKRVSRDELIENKRKREEEERQRIEDERLKKEAEERKAAQVEETKSKLLGLLGS